MIALYRLPLFLLLTGVASVAMLVPAGFALAIEAHKEARSFLYAGLLGMFVTGLSALALANRPPSRNQLWHLVSLLAGFVLLPVLLALPFYEALRTTTFLSAYFEMLSSLTTTGATLFNPARLSEPLHLWRAMVGWMGGLIMWIAAAAIMAPLAIGGFEVTASGEPGQPVAAGALASARTAPAARLQRATEALVPVYAGLTGGLCILLMVVGEAPFVALCHAMSVMATSGITPGQGLSASTTGIGGEAIMAVFLLFALSRMTFSRDTVQSRSAKLRDDPEVRMGLAIIMIVPLLLFLRHWVAAFEFGEEENLIAGFRAFWGSLFTALSFLVTAGFVSNDWATAQDWSGLPTPGLILMGLAIFGGGVATTAGGVKLLRVYALYLTSTQELEKLVLPHSVSNPGLFSRRIRREGGFIAWVFFMLFALTVAALTVGLGLMGAEFEESMVLTVATLTNTGPLISVASSTPIDLIALSPGAKLMLCVGMVLGRLEVLAIIVMFSPDLWRD